MQVFAHARGIRERRRITKPATVAAILVWTLPVSGFAAGPRGMISQFSGSYVQNATAANGGNCPAGGCVGDLVTCAADEVISIAKFKVTFVQNICDDHTPGATACAGRFTGITEECFKTSAPGTITNGSVTHFNSRGKTRDCFDNTGVGDCTGSPPSGIVYLKGNTRTQSRLVSGSPVEQNGELIVKKAPSFLDPADGQTKQFKDAGLMYQNTAQPNEGTSCGGSCGFAGVSFLTN